jgi:uncharacterized membrane protein
MFFLIFLVVPMTIITAEPDILPNDLKFTIFNDGVISVEYNVLVDPTKVKVYVPLFGSMFENLLVFNQNAIPLDFTFNETGIIVDSLGAVNLDISYYTPSLSNKEGAIWTFEVNLSITSQVILPQDSTIINLDPMPLDISTVNERLELIIPPGSTKISYLVEILDVETIAANAINNTQTIIDNIRNEGILILEAEELLQQARKSFEEKKFSETKLLAEEAKNNALSIKEKADAAFSEIDKAVSAIDAAKNSGKTVGLEIAEDLLEEAHLAYSNGDYLTAFHKANQAFEAGIVAEFEKNDNTFLIYLGAATLLIILLLYYRKRSLKSGPVIEFGEVDLDHLFDIHDDLREDDRDVIEFLAEKGGEAFAMEIRERFNIPRTSTWRLIKRLERYEIINERKVGGQTLVRIKDEYRERIK